MGQPVQGHYLILADLTVEPLATFSIANINPGTVRAEFMRSVLNVVNYERQLQHTVDPAIPRVHLHQFKDESAHGPYLDDGRNMCAEWFLNHTSSDYLLFVDSDIAFWPEHAYSLITTMANHGVTVCSGIYYSLSIHKCLNGMSALAFNWGPNPYMKSLDDDEPVQDLIPLSDTDILSLTPQDKPHPIGSTGGGFLAIHRQVFLDMIAANQPGDPTPFFAKQVVNGIAMGEDHVFCLRANALNHTPHILPSVVVDHYKTCIVRPITA